MLTIYMLCEVYYERHYSTCSDEDCYYMSHISREVVYHNHGGGNAEVINLSTGKKTLTGISWISQPIGKKDSLVVFSDGKKRGYFNKFTGEVAIPAKYSRAWVFSDGIASVEENGMIKFIDGKGNQVFDRTFIYDSEEDGYVFHGGYCIIDSNEDHKYGLMNTQGKTVVPEDYDDIEISSDYCYWTMTKGTEASILDKNLKQVFHLTECSDIVITDVDIDVTMLDNTIRKYDFQGNLIDDFYIRSFQYLEYETEETYQTQTTYTDDEGNEHAYLSDPVHKTQRAKLCKYTAGNYKEGLMTAEGNRVTMPKYEDITAVGPDTYLCTVSNGDNEILNGKGQKVK